MFVLDGVLIGAGDGTYLAKAGALVARGATPRSSCRRRGRRRGWCGSGLTFTVVLMGARAVVLVRRERGDAWLVTGVRTRA